MIEFVVCMYIYTYIFLMYTCSFNALRLRPSARKRSRHQSDPVRGLRSGSSSASSSRTAAEAAETRPWDCPPPARRTRLARQARMRSKAETAENRAPTLTRRFDLSTSASHFECSVRSGTERRLLSSSQLK